MTWIVSGSSRSAPAGRASVISSPDPASGSSRRSDRRRRPGEPWSSTSSKPLANVSGCTVTSPRLSGYAIVRSRAYTGDNPVSMISVAVVSSSRAMVPQMPLPSVVWNDNQTAHLSNQDGRVLHQLPGVGVGCGSGCGSTASPTYTTRTASATMSVPAETSSEIETVPVPSNR